MTGCKEAIINLSMAFFTGLRTRILTEGYVTVAGIMILISAIYTFNKNKAKTDNEKNKEERSTGI